MWLNYQGRGLDTVEERRLLELDEAIEAVDAAIEYKNEVICSRIRELGSPVKFSSFLLPDERSHLIQTDLFKIHY